jgi:hypothetical protein
MSCKAATPQDFYLELKKIIPNLPDECVSLKIEVRMDSPVEITAICWAQTPDDDCDLVAKNFYLVEQS